MRVAQLPCLVTGASRGIGRAVAEALAGRGCRIALLARDAEALAATAERCRERGGEARAFSAEVSDEAAMNAAITAAIDWAGGLRLAIVNAGVGVHGAALQLDPAAARAAVDVNFLGAVTTVRAVVPALLAAPPAALVAVSSLSALIPYRGGGAYAASKAALVAYLRCLRLELAGTGVRVGWLCPGPVDTRMIIDGVPQTRLPRLARWLVPTLTPERAAAEVLRVASGAGGQRVVPVTARVFAALARLTPRLAERLELLTGAGEA